MNQDQIIQIQPIVSRLQTLNTKISEISSQKDAEIKNLELIDQVLTKKQQELELAFKNSQNIYKPSSSPTAPKTSYSKELDLKTKAIVEEISKFDYDPSYDQIYTEGNGEVVEEEQHEEAYKELKRTEIELGVYKLLAGGEVFKEK
ncbi:unnamed protein product [Moneuplotes crassus]|uniref:Uncharacterized protein n=2 Tax=Euplotes crassus TaxID=5936 RepID=A0AAD1Y0S4_EUPCR|nr:unnamed protein product [Moneuplotes crassus]